MSKKQDAAIAILNIGTARPMPESPPVINAKPALRLEERGNHVQ
jgi:hypothetical protein